MPGLEEKLANALRRRQEQSIFRSLPSGTTSLIDFSSNDFLSLSTSTHLRSHFIDQLRISERILGAGGSRLLTDLPGHDAVEIRLASFFRAPAALLFNSGSDANVGFFSSVPQKGDVVLYDEHIHASVHHGMRASRAHDSTFPFRHNCLVSLKELLTTVLEDRPSIRRSENSVFVAVESLYSMHGDFAPLTGIADLVDLMLPQGNAHLIVDEAHSTGLYGEQGRGIVSLLGLENRVTARLHTFGKALASNGAVIVTTPLIRQYLINYARTLIYTTALSHAAVINISCSLDMLEEVGQQLARHLSRLCSHFLRSLRHRLQTVPSDLIRLPVMLWASTDSESWLLSPIIPLLTPYPRPLATKLRALGFLTSPITHPTVPKGQDRLRICIHAGNTIEQIDGLLAGIIAWDDEQRRVDTMDVFAKL